MRFHLVDRLLDVVPNQSIRMVKNLTSGEEYLADHFPTFPVMPGVLMLETLVESAAWLLRISSDFQHSVIALREAKNVKYGSFMEPGKSMIVSAELAEDNGSLVTFKGKGEANGNQTVSAKFTLVRYNLKDRDPAFEGIDRRIIEQQREMYAILSGRLGCFNWGQDPLCEAPFRPLGKGS